MEEDLLSIPPDFKLYKDRAIYLGTFLGGPLVGGYLTAENFKQLGQEDKVKTTWLIGIGVTIAIFTILFLVPGIQKLPNYIIPIIYAGITQYIIKKMQGPAIEAHIQNGGQTYSSWRAAWIGLVGAIILVAIIVIILVLQNKNVFA